MDKRRQDRLNSEFKKIISNSIMNLNTTQNDLITITECKVSLDLSYLDVYFTCMSANKSDEILEKLNSASGFIKHDISNNIKIRQIPKLRFHYDETLDYADKINNLLKKINIDEEEN